MVRVLPLLLGILALPVCGGEALPLELVRLIEVDGRQGVAVDGDRYYVSGSTALYVYNQDGELLLSNEEPCVKLEKEANHIGDISVHAGEIFAARPDPLALFPYRLRGHYTDAGYRLIATEMEDSYPFPDE